MKRRAFFGKVLRTLIATLPRYRIQGLPWVHEGGFHGRSRRCSEQGLRSGFGIDPKGPRTQIIRFQGPNTTILMVFGP